MDDRARHDDLLGVVGAEVAVVPEVDMIPLVMGAFAKVPWRLIGAVGLVAVVAWMGHTVSGWKSSHEALPGVRDALEREEGCLDGSKCADRVAALTVRQEQITADTVAGYEKELEDLRNRPVSVRTVRLCPEKPDRDVRHAPVSGGTGQGSAPAGVVHAGTGPDIGPGLYALAGVADELAAQCRAIIQRDRGLAAQ
jgi:hypothetical protein